MKYVLIFLNIFLLIHLNLFRLQRLRLLFSYYHRLYFITGWFVNVSMPLLYSIKEKRASAPKILFISVFSHLLIKDIVDDFTELFL